MNRVDIIVLDCSTLCTDDIYWKAFISPVRHKKLESIAHPNAKKLSLGAELALAAALSYKNLPHTPPEYYYDNNGKPLFHDNGLYFSLSHTQNTAVCAISDAEVGVDTEYARHISPHISRFALSPLEKDCTSDEILKKWVIKESYLKLTGNGITPDSMYRLTAENGLVYSNNGKALANYSLFDNLSSDGFLISCCSFSEFSAHITALSINELKK